jgi:hypothetical protein
VQGNSMYLAKNPEKDVLKSGNEKFKKRAVYKK